MTRDRLPSPDCTAAREALREEWIGGPPRGLAAREVHAHVEACVACRGEALNLSRIDSTLFAGLSLLVERAPPLTEERIAETIRRASEEAFESRLLRRVRRPFRLVLWTAFFLFTLLAACLLAVAVFKALG
jgi:predicted anti-sigma-YlaC factor YlaD